MFDSLLPLKLHLSRTLASKSLIWRVLVPNHWVPGNIVHEFHWVLPTKSRVKAVNPRIPALRGNYKQKTLRISRTQGDSRRLKETQGLPPNPMVFCWIIMFPIVQLPIGCPGASDPASSFTMSPGRPRPTTWREGYNNSAPLRTVPVHGTRGNPGEPGGTRGTLPQTNNMGMDQYLLLSILVGWTSIYHHLPSFTSYFGFH